MIQFNLLPSIKLEYVKARRNKRLTILGAMLVGSMSLVILVILFVSVQIIQKKYSHDLSTDIKKQSSTFSGLKDLDKVLTIQNQLASLTTLHDQKPAATRVYAYLKQLTPAKVSIASMSVDFVTQEIKLTGSADTISSVNKYVDTLKFTTYQSDDNRSGNAFSAVVLGSIGRDDKGARYDVALKFDPVIFSNTNKITLIVPPNKITTRSETEKPDALFQSLSNSGAKQ